MYRQSKKSYRKNSVKQQYLLHMSHNMANIGPLTAEIGSGVWGTPANFSGFRVLPLSLQRRRSPEANQTFTVFGRLLGWYTIIHFRRLLPPDGILPREKFTIRPSLAFSYIGSVTARHSSSGHQPNFAAWYK